MGTLFAFKDPELFSYKLQTKKSWQERCIERKERQEVNEAGAAEHPDSGTRQIREEDYGRDPPQAWQEIPPAIVKPWDADCFLRFSTGTETRPDLEPST